MPFPKETRSWWMRVWGDGNASDASCEWDTLTEKKGIVQCGRDQKLELHHIKPEGWTIEQGDDENPNEALGIPMCHKHHSGRDGDMLTGGGSFHPDFGNAKRNYFRDKDGFNRVVADHKADAQAGIIYWNNDADEHYLEKTQEKATRYTAQNPDDPKPDVKRHKKQKRKKRWYDIFD